MIIGVDGSRYREGDATGVEWYSYLIVNELMRLVAEKPSEQKLRVYVREGSHKHWPLKPGVEIKVIEARRLWTLWGLSNEMRHSPTDVLFVPSHVFPLRLAKKNVITIHDVAWRRFKKTYGWFQRWYLNWSTRYAIRHADKIIVPSETTKADLKKFFRADEKRVIVIPHGFSEPPAKPNDELFEKSEVFNYFGIKPDSKYWLYVGRLESKKNLERVVEAFKEFALDHPDFKLVLAGKRGVGAEALIRKVGKLKMADKVIMPGYVDEEEKATLYKYCQGVVFASLYEGFGLPVLESFYYRKPILISDCAALREVAGDAGWVAQAQNVATIVDGLRRLTDDHDLVAKIIERGQARLQDFDWKKCGKETLKILTD